MAFSGFYKATLICEKKLEPDAEVERCYRVESFMGTSKVDAYQQARDAGWIVLPLVSLPDDGGKEPT